MGYNEIIDKIFEKYYDYIALNNEKPNTIKISMHYCDVLYDTFIKYNSLKNIQEVSEHPKIMGMTVYPSLLEDYIIVFSE